MSAHIQANPEGVTLNSRGRKTTDKREKNSHKPQRGDIPAPDCRHGSIGDGSVVDTDCN